MIATKIRVLERGWWGGGFTKKQYIGEIAYKGEGVLGQFADLGGGLGKKERVVFLRGVDTPIHTMTSKHLLLWCFFVFCS